MRFVIVTGMSGAGKSTALKKLEDMGFFCVDNLPVMLIKRFADIAYDDEGASLLINTNEQMIAEKLRSLLRLGTLSTRYKDVFDIYYLCQHADIEKLSRCLSIYIFDDPAMREKDIVGVYKRISMVFKDRMYLSNLRSRDANWLGEDVDVVLKGILDYIRSLEV